MMEELLRKALMDALAPLYLEIQNESALHQGHTSSPQTGSSHFFVSLYAPSLITLSRVEAHRRVNDAAKEAWGQGLHALRIQILKEMPQR
ncbi:MAG: BolA family transcriptional regulator [Alphaproteobacteria bacterium]|nr:BolA family transcriptional regulator [Alphaproteobacteria bacterium]